ncbi:MAG: MmgE/PrpD family protein [Spirochaetota bacterium]|nr:MmgE/PrpD family protein [Spirochaetota bacterium]
MGTEKVAQFITDTSYEKIPKEAINSSKQAILDCLGVMLAGCDDPGCKILNEYIKEEGGVAEAGIIGGNLKTTASQAAWANGNIAHSLDYDDYAAAFVGHPTVALLPAILSISEKLHLSGREILLSYVIGFETGAAVSPLCGLQSYMVGWHTTSTIGAIGAVAAAAKLLNLTVDQTRMALGIASSLSNGLKENFGTMTKPLHAGNAAKNGVVAAILAKKGFTANENILEGEQGFCRVFAGGAEIDANEIGKSLGEEYTVAKDLSMKPYPSCAGTHATIDCGLYLNKNYDINPEEIEDIEIRINPGLAKSTIHSNPQTGLEGKFSNEYCVATALVEGEVGLKHFTDEKVNQPVIKRLVERAKYNNTEETALGSEVLVTLRDGNVLSHKVNSPKGFVDNPVTMSDTEIKYTDCASLIMPKGEVDRSLQLITNLEELKDVVTLMDILTYRGKSPAS